MPWSPCISFGLTRCWCRKEQQQKEWEGRQADRKAREAEMAGEPFDREVGPRYETGLRQSNMSVSAEAALHVVRFGHI